MASRSVGVCLLGVGTVGGGVAQILRNQHDLLLARTGVDFQIRHAAVRAPEDAPRDIPGLPITTDAMSAVNDPASDIIVELIGGTGAAATLIRRALELGKPVVTANKSLLAKEGPELFSLARKHNACIAFEASCGGGIPIIDALQRGLIANRIDALLGIVNGTCNVILTRMTQNGWTYAQALAEAQKLGFAEANPTLDISGQDAAQKLAILASLAFGVRVAPGQVHVEGIDQLQPTDIKMAHELGYVIKLLAIGQRTADGRISLRVHPTLVHKSDVLADVSGGFNAISVYGHALGHALFYGRGAGRTPTASAVVADLVSVATGATPLLFKQLHLYPDQTPPAAILPFEQLQSRYYLRIAAKDQPGVLAQITAILGKNGISVSAILQQEIDADQFVPVVITTHLAREGAMAASLAEINALNIVNAPTVCLRIIDQPAEFADLPAVPR